MKKIFIILALAGILLGGGVWYVRSATGSRPQYKTVAVERGDLQASISATGTLEPEEVVDVGAQVAGLVSSFGKDAKGNLVDYGSPVEAGTVLAQIDPKLYKAQLDQADANLKKAQADLVHMKAVQVQAERDWGRAQQLGHSASIADVDYDTAWATYETAKANVGVDQAIVAQCQAALDQAKINLDYCTIQSPVKGVIVDRRVNIGQTVVSSLNAPSLFLIAKDLKRMQIWASVNEADIGRIHAGQAVTFTVDAFSGQTFQGKVNEVRLNATMTQNVVTYTVVVDTDNSSGKLLPYMTANLQIQVQRQTGVLKVANAALRWTPDVKAVAPDARDKAAQVQRHGSAGPAPSAPPAGPLPGGRGGSADHAAQPAPPTAGPRPEYGLVWVEDNGYVRPVRVRIGLTDGSTSEISGKGVQEGMRVVVGELRASETDQATNPFAPQFQRRNNNPQPQQ
jgi:HlyD family secretion protein